LLLGVAERQCDGGVQGVPSDQVGIETAMLSRQFLGGPEHPDQFGDQIRQLPETLVRAAKSRKTGRKSGSPSPSLPTITASNSSA